MKCLYFEKAPIFYVFANILGKRQYFMILLSIVIIINSVLTLQVSTAKPMIADLVE